jgi:mRNA interferase MazF
MASVDDLWFVDFGEPYPGEPAWHRPALVLGPPEAFGPRFPFVIVVPLTTARRGLSLHVEVESSPSTGLDEVSYVQCELIQSVNRKRLVHRLGTVDSTTSEQVAGVVATLLRF